MGPISVISLLSLTTFSVPPEETGDRLAMNITLLLTAVAFKYTTSSYLPQISYMTLVDKFNMFCMLVILISCLSHTAIGCLDHRVGLSEARLELVSDVFCGSTFLVWIGAQAWFLRMKVRMRYQKSFNHKSMEKRRGSISVLFS